MGFFVVLPWHPTPASSSKSVNSVYDPAIVGADSKHLRLISDEGAPSTSACFSALPGVSKIFELLCQHVTDDRLFELRRHDTDHAGLNTPIVNTRKTYRSLLALTGTPTG